MMVNSGRSSSAILVPEIIISKEQLVPANMERNDFLRIVKTFHDVQHQTCSRPFPVLLGGKEVDLFDLNVQVKATGGYDAAHCKWSSIAQNLGFGPECGPALKLVYVKYLKALESWKKLPGKEDVNILHYDHLSPTEINRVMAMGDASNKSNDCLCGNSLKRMPEEVTLANDSGNQEIDKGGYCQYSSENCITKDSDERCLKRIRLLKSASDSLPESGMLETCISTAKGTESLSSLLEWIRRIALNPGDPKKGQGTCGSSQNENWVEDCLAQASRIRALLWKKKESLPSHALQDTSFRLFCMVKSVIYGSGYVQQNRQMIRPSLYYQEVPKPDIRALDRLRVTRERIGKYVSPLTCAKVGNMTYQKHEAVQHVAETPTSFLTAMNEMYCLGDLLARGRKRIPIGSDFQASVPPWKGPPEPKLTGSAGKTIDANLSYSSMSEDADSHKYLGTVIWPVNGLEILENKEGIGKGRSLRCYCIYPGSKECVKLHVQVERERLRLELGEAFETMGFNNMGENVSDSWLAKEELSFREIVRANAVSDGKDFWYELPAAFCSKSMKELVSYYFNVYVLRRRAVQNRLMPGPIDSDDDEVEIGEIESETCRTSRIYKNRSQIVEGNVSQES